LGFSKNGSKCEVYGNIGLPQEARNISNKQPILTPNGARQRATYKNQTQQEEGYKKEQKV